MTKKREKNVKKERFRFPLRAQSVAQNTHTLKVSEVVAFIDPGPSKIAKPLH